MTPPPTTPTSRGSESRGSWSRGSEEGLPSRRRKPVFASQGVVATSQPLAASVGLNILRRGGTAVDAAVAAAVTLTVVQPGSNDIGGDLFAIVWDGQRLYGLNGSGRSPAGLTRPRVLASGSAPRGCLGMGGSPSPCRGRRRAGGTCTPASAAWSSPNSSRTRSGTPRTAIPCRRPWPRCGLAPRRCTPTLTGPEFQAWPSVFAPGGRTPRAGEWWRNPDAARSLRLIAESGAAAFYSGEIAEAMAQLSALTGGTLSAEDLSGHGSLWVDPISVGYRDHEVWELPPNGQGIAALSALGILDGLDLEAMPLERRLHAQIEAMKLGYADAHAFVGDPETSPAPVAALLSPSYMDSRRALMGETAALPVSGEPVRAGTVYLCAADRDGMMVSLIQSNYHGFGSFVVVPGYGFGLQNRGCGFVLDEAHPNVVGPRKRPYHTIIPGFLTREGEAVGPFGVMGGHMQPQGHVQLVLATVDRRLDPQTALGESRWRWETGRRVFVEPEFGPGPIDALVQRGHDVVVGHRPEPVRQWAGDLAAAGWSGLRGRVGAASRWAGRPVLTLRPDLRPAAAAAIGATRVPGCRPRRPHIGQAWMMTEDIWYEDIERIVVTEEQIRDKIDQLAKQIAVDYRTVSSVLLVGVLKGAVMFMADFSRALGRESRPVELEFMAVSSYGQRATSSGVVRILKDLDRDIAGRHVIVVEDIVDSGLTLSWLLKYLESRSAASVEVVALLRKPDAIKVDAPVKYVGFDIPNEFVVGYGLDFAERYRELPFIGVLRPSVYSRT